MYRPISLAFPLLLLLLLGHQIISGRQSDDDKSCDYNPSDSAVEEHSPDGYHLFSTKTSYLVAREAIKKRFGGEWPPEVKQCRPIYLYLLARHAIRYPKAADIKYLSQLLYSIRNELLYSRNISYKMFLYLANWRFRMVETDDNHVTPSGKNETARIAEIYHDYFPELLDLERTTFDVGVSTKIRTEETADAFIDSLIRKQLARTPDSESRLNQIKEEKFKKSKPDLLMSHRHCKNVMKSKGKKPSPSKDFEKLANSETIKQMLIDFSERNDLGQTLSIDSMLGIYRACSYETAIYGFSPWCLLFRRSELKEIEYLLDIDEYHDAYEITEHRKMACPVIVDLKSKVESIMKQTTDSNTTTTTPTNATLYFSHENLLSKVWSYLRLFQRFPKTTLPDSARAPSPPGVLCIPKDREWRASLVVPFGTNFAAILYKCPTTTATTTTTGITQPFKLLTLVNEIPVVIRGCDSAFCDVEQFFREFTVPQTQCNVEHICGL